MMQKYMQSTSHSLSCIFTMKKMAKKRKRNNILHRILPILRSRVKKYFKKCVSGCVKTVNIV